MRSASIHLLLLVAALLAGAGAALDGNAAAAANKKPSCAELGERRSALIAESEALTSKVEAKNAQLGETADALAAAESPARKKELTRRRDGLRREVSTLLDRELDTVNQLGALDAEISSRCKKGGAR